MHLYNVVLKLEPKFFTQSVTISKENVQKKPVKNHHMPGNMKNWTNKSFKVYKNTDLKDFVWNKCQSKNVFFPADKFWKSC